MPRVRPVKPIRKPTTIVSFDFEDRTYQIDPGLRKVYQKFVEIETSRADTIFQSWRAQATTA